MQKTSRWENKVLFFAWIKKIRLHSNILTRKENEETLLFFLVGKNTSTLDANFLVQQSKSLSKSHLCTWCQRQNAVHVVYKYFSSRKIVKYTTWRYFHSLPRRKSCTSRGSFPSNKLMLQQKIKLPSHPSKTLCYPLILHLSLLSPEI